MEKQISRKSMLRIAIVKTFWLVLAITCMVGMLVAGGTSEFTEYQRLVATIISAFGMSASIYATLNYNK